MQQIGSLPQQASPDLLAAFTTQQEQIRELQKQLQRPQDHHVRYSSPLCSDTRQREDVDSAYSSTRGKKPRVKNRTLHIPRVVSVDHIIDRGGSPSGMLASSMLDESVYDQALPPPPRSQSNNSSLASSVFKRTDFHRTPTRITPKPEPRRLAYKPNKSCGDFLDKTERADSRPASDRRGGSVRRLASLMFPSSPVPPNGSFSYCQNIGTVLLHI